MLMAVRASRPSDRLRAAETLAEARAYTASFGGFEKFAEWGLI